MVIQNGYTKRVIVNLIDKKTDRDVDSKTKLEVNIRILQFWTPYTMEKKLYTVTP